ncbi:MAG: alpha-glucan family phosphorylase [Desulfohalobiaceae bacterium]|nr:alpha-glucan family phosphorylase [Desulfohalobiaceae bacterium]
MPKDTRLFPHLPERIAGLEDLAENLWWSWQPAARMLFKRLNRPAWKDSGHNPDKMLRGLPARYLEQAAADQDYLRHYHLVMWRFQQETRPVSCRELGVMSDASRQSIAYFSAEYGLHHSLPFYAGGLGFLAGDHLKECSDLGVPLIGVGFMYPRGYLLQRINEHGWQEDVAQGLDREAATISRVFDSQGNQMIVSVPLIQPKLNVAVWSIEVGRTRLYLLDTDIEQNEHRDREICGRLYVGDPETRLRQEIILGLGGMEVLKALGRHQFVIHLNEGHPAFALLVKVQDLVAQGRSFEEAAKQVHAASIFTTHTPVPAGHDIFSRELMERYFSSYWPSLGLDRDGFLELGEHRQSPYPGFNMTILALRLCGHCNGVSQEHGRVSRQMWQSLWPEKSVEEVPITHVTNGVHLPTWISPKMRLLFDKYLGPDWVNNPDMSIVWEFVDEIPDEELWQTHYWQKIKLIDAMRAKVRRRRSRDRAGPNLVLAGGTMLDPSILTIGFGRRFATYKRAGLILSDLKRLKKLAADPWTPLQIIFSGKAHPADEPGKKILQQVFTACLDPELGGRIAFLENYDEQFAQYMLHGVDVWLNNPVPPMEASGTSGMKAALNGVPHLSILDGWWLEGYNRVNGWAFGRESAEGNRDVLDAADLYDVLEQEIIPLYYDVSENGVPCGWVRVMKEAIKSNAPRFSSRRMVKQYLEKFYAPAMAMNTRG